MKLEINHKLAGIVPMANAAEQAALTLDIKANGQLEEIVLWQGKIIDGRCRNLACETLNIEPKIKELPWNTTEHDAISIVKSLNTRRNLTPTQKIMSACKVSMDKSYKRSITSIAKEWGIGTTVLKNARYIANTSPELIEPLFDGNAVTIISSDGRETTSVKISAIYAHLKRLEEKVEERSNIGWEESGLIQTQAGKDWYYCQTKLLGVKCVPTRMMIAELANFKFPKN